MPRPTLRPLPAGVLDRPLAGRRLGVASLRSLLQDGPLLLSFLRHFGCGFCRETVRAHRRDTQVHPGHPPVVFVLQGTVEQGDAFFEHVWPEARAIADPSRALFDAFGVRRARLGQVLGPGALARAASAAVRGNGIGRPVGSPLRMPGLVLLDDEQILWTHPFRHVGDRPGAETILRAVARATASTEVPA